MYPAVSVVIPAYNAGRYLAQAVRSVQEQQVQAAEIIVIDDGSVDDTAAVVRGMGNTVHGIYQANAGVSAARNAGIAAARGEFIAFLDADDEWLPEKVARQMQVFEVYPDVALVACDRTDVDARGAVLSPSLFENKGLREQFAQLSGAPLPQALAQIVRINFIPTSSVVVRKSALDDVGLFDQGIRYGEDLELWARIAARYPIVCLPDVLIRYRLHDSNATQATAKLLKDIVVVMEKIRSWGSATLVAQGVDADAMVALALWELGYWHFQYGTPRDGYTHFLRSFREKPSARSLAYAAASLMPTTALARMRNLKQRIVG